MTLLLNLGGFWTLTRRGDPSQMFNEPTTPVDWSIYVAVAETATLYEWRSRYQKGSGLIAGVNSLRPEFVEGNAPPFIRPYSGSTSLFRIVGQTLDAAGLPLANCIVQGFLTSGLASAGLAADAYVGEVTSDNEGYFEFWTPYTTSQHYLVCYLQGSPDRTGASVNTLIPTAP